MTKQEQIEEIRKEIENGFRKADCRQPYTNEPYPYFETQKTAIAKALYDAGYRKTFTNEMVSDTQKAFKEGYEKGCEACAQSWDNGYNDGFEDGKEQAYKDCYDKTRKETAKEILQEWADDNSSMGLDNTFVKNIAEKYGVEVEE